MRILFVFCFFLLLYSCGNLNSDFSGPVLRQGEDLPPSFEPPAGLAFDEISCKSPLVDPRDGTKILMIRSTGAIGEYDAPAGKYGLRQNELLRINCQTGEIYGVVKR